MKKIDIHIWRRTVQIGVAALFIMLPVLNAAGFNFIWGNFLNVHVGSLTFADPLAVFQVIIKNKYLPRLKYMAWCLRKRKYPENEARNV